MVDVARWRHRGRLRRQRVRAAVPRHVSRCERRPRVRARGRDPLRRTGPRRCHHARLRRGQLLDYRVKRQDQGGEGLGRQRHHQRSRSSRTPTPPPARSSTTSSPTPPCRSPAPGRTERSPSPRAPRTRPSPPAHRAARRASACPRARSGPASEPHRPRLDPNPEDDVPRRRHRQPSRVHDHLSHRVDPERERGARLRLLPRRWRRRHGRRVRP